MYIDIRLCVRVVCMNLDLFFRSCIMLIIVEDAELYRLTTYMIGVAQYLFLATLGEMGDFRGNIGEICRLLLLFR